MTELGPYLQKGGQLTAKWVYPVSLHLLNQTAHMAMQCHVYLFTFTLPISNSEIYVNYEY